MTHSDMLSLASRFIDQIPVLVALALVAFQIFYEKRMKDLKIKRRNLKRRDFIYSESNQNYTQRQSPEDDPYIRRELQEYARGLRRILVRYNFRLTPAAIVMLTAPVEESLLYDGGDFPAAFALESVDRIIGGMAAKASDSPKYDITNSGDAKAVIREFHEQFCGIPPFCDRKYG